MKLEICANSIQSAINAQNGGADRIELCEDLSIGGVTPSYDLIKGAKERLNIPVYVLIRPRGGDFMYTYQEIEQMKQDIAFCAQQQMHGVVIGGLTERGDIDERLSSELMQLAGFMDVTFHRAFDEVPNQLESLDALKEIGVQRILTSGGKGRAIDNLDQLGVLIDEADDDLIIMPGGGIRPDNAIELIDVGAQEIHSSCLVNGEAYSNLEMIRSLRSIISK